MFSKIKSTQIRGATELAEVSSSAALETYAGSCDEEMWLLNEAVGTLHYHFVKDLLSVGSILQFSYSDYKETVVKKESENDMALTIAELVKPFLLEVQNARQLPSEVIVKEIESKINGLENKLVGVKNLKVVGNQGWTLMREGEAEKQKQYCALVWISCLLEDEDIRSMSLLNDMQILQRTPIRVLDRRSPLEREKIIHWLAPSHYTSLLHRHMKIDGIAGSSQYFLLHLCTQNFILS
ncbi:hypothetical protein REPUB_Repub02eG0011100 [Reevesia pubescens]